MFLFADPGPDWFSIAQSFGLPVLLLAFGCWTVYNLGKWAGTNIAMPLVTRCISFIDSVDKTQIKNADTNASIVVTMSHVLERVEKLSEQSLEISRLLTTAREMGVHADTLIVNPPKPAPVKIEVPHAGIGG